MPGCRRDLVQMCGGQGSGEKLPASLCQQGCRPGILPCGGTGGSWGEPGIEAGDGLGTRMLLVQVALPPTFQTCWLGQAVGAAGLGLPWAGRERLGRAVLTPQTACQAVQVDTIKVNMPSG